MHVGTSVEDAAESFPLVAWYVRGFITKTDVSLVFASISTPNQGVGRFFSIDDAKFDPDDAIWTVSGQGGELVAILEQGTTFDPGYVRHKALVDADPRLAASALTFAELSRPKGSVEIRP